MNVDINHFKHIFRRSLNRGKRGKKQCLDTNLIKNMYIISGQINFGNDQTYNLVYSSSKNVL